MANKTYTPEQIINKLREAEVSLSQGSNIGEASRWSLSSFRKVGAAAMNPQRQWRKTRGEKNKQKFCLW
ncbi:hypothetical protein ES707_11925 [subsurface metagenome]